MVRALSGADVRRYGYHRSALHPQYLTITIQTSQAEANGGVSEECTLLRKVGRIAK